MDLTDVNLEYNLNAICPYCGHEHRDSWEYHMSDGDENIECCNSCGKEFKIECTITVTYSTRKLGAGKSN